MNSKNKEWAYFRVGKMVFVIGSLVLFFSFGVAADSYVSECWRRLVC